MTDKELFDTWWLGQYDLAMQFRDWQSCENLHTAKDWQTDGFLAACEIKNKEIEELKARLNTMSDLVAELRDSYLEIDKEFSEKHFMELFSCPEICLEVIIEWFKEKKIGKNAEI